VAQTALAPPQTTKIRKSYFQIMHNQDNEPPAATLTLLFILISVIGTVIYTISHIISCL
jgi:hypothetical protein